MCPDIGVTSDTSVMIISGDRTVTGHCDRAVISGDLSSINLMHLMF